MKMKLKIALRNIFRHKGRTSVSLLMIAGAVIGLVLFNGFADYILANMRRIVIDNQYGHIQIGQKAFWELTPGSRKSQFIGNANAIADSVKKEPGVTNVSGRISFYGLISTGDITVSAKGMAFDVGQETELTSKLEIDQGSGLNANSKLDVIIGAGLQKKLNVQDGQSVTILSYTLDGVVNAIELKVQGIFKTSNSEVDDNVFMFPLSMAQSLLDTEGVEVLAVRLANTDDTNQIRDRIQTRLEASRMPNDENSSGYQAKTWFELANFYRQVAKFFATQNHVIQFILLTLVFLGILNTVGMSVYERTGEIGTVRALGESEQSVIAQFTLEGLILGIIGATVGVVLSAAISFLVAALNIQMDMPGTSSAIPIVIHFVPSAYVGAVAVAILAATAATWVPAIRASKMSIVEALKKNI